MTRTIPARQAGTCRQCGEPFPKGTTISPFRHGYAGWGHVECVAQYRRDVAADDLDALTYGYGA